MTTASNTPEIVVVECHGAVTLVRMNHASKRTALMVRNSSAGANR